MAQQGVLRGPLLALLADHPSTSHELSTRLGAEVGMFWEWSGPTLINNLVKNLHDRLHYIEVVDHDAAGRPLYDLTDEGAAMLQRWRAEIDAEPPPRRDDLLLRVLHADPHALREFVKDREFRVTEQQQRVHRALEKGPPPGVNSDAWDAVLECVLIKIAADFEVAQRVEDYLDAHSARPKASQRRNQGRAAG